MPDPSSNLTDREDSWRACREAGQEAFRRGRLAEAEQHFQDALQIAELSGPVDLRVADSLLDLAMICARQPWPSRRGAEAEPLLRRALAIREQTMGPDHPEVAQTLVHVG